MGKPFRIKDRLMSFKYAWRGICRFIGQEHNAWIHCTVMALVVCAGFFFGISRGEWIAVILCFALVLAAEAFNTAIERIVDKVSPERCQVAGDIKDIAAGAVLVCAIGAAVVGVVVFGPYVLDFILLA